MSETWLTNEDTPPLFDNNRSCQLNRNNKEGGGGATNVREDLACELVDDVSAINDDFENIIAHLGKVVIPVVYRPPSCEKGKRLLLLEEMLTLLCSTKLPFFVVRDININTIGDDVYANAFFALALT